MTLSYPSRSVWLAVTLALVVVTYVWQLRAPFELQDDHRILGPVLRPDAGALPSYVMEIRKDFHEVGRFRPVNQIFDVIGPHVLGANPLVWHLCLLTLAMVVTVLLFTIGDRLFLSPVAGAVLSLTTMLAPDPGPASAWYRLGPKEGWGMLFLAVAVLLIVRRASDRVALIFVTLAAFSKESFLLTLPALFGFRWWFEARDAGVRAAFRKLRTLAVAYSGVLAVGLAGVFLAVRSAGEHSYGARSLDLTPGEVLGVLVRDAAKAPLLAAWLVPVVLAFFVRRPTWLAMAVFAAWIGPQYLLHGTRGGFWDHYWLPCVGAFAMANASAMAALARSTLLRRVSMTVLVLWTANTLRTNIPAVLNHVEKARVQQQTVRIAAENATAGTDLVIVHDPQSQSETAPAFAAFARANGGAFRQAVLVTPQTLPANIASARAVAFLDEGEREGPPRAGWERFHARGSRRYVSLREGGLRVIPFDLTVEVRGR